MSHAEAAIGLLRAILRENCLSDSAARKHLAEADRLGVDPLDYCAHRFSIRNGAVWMRAAAWAGISHAAIVSASPGQSVTHIAHLERLGEARSLRQNVLGRDVIFIAPNFDQVQRLKAARVSRPGLADDVRFVSPDQMEAGLCRAASAQLMAEARQKLTQIWPWASASQDLPRTARVGFVVCLAAAIVIVMAAGLVARPVLVPLVALLLMAPGLMRLLAAIPAKATIVPRLLSDNALPFYTVLIPLRDEAAMVPMLQRAMAALDYPPEKLDIKFVVESRSAPTIAAVKRLLDDNRFRLIVVPEGGPHTKPKAINYALPLARGTHVVVYDAEDVPDPGQLRLAASHFAADPGVACLQAELVPDNGSENALTALFAGEYAGLFGRLLPALARWDMPVPLGGTSNHFRTETLRQLGGWDAFNVTEDADLGVRLARRGLRAETFASRTYEEAPLGIAAWMAQRTRWMKGWMQTFIVHNRAPRRFLKDIGWRGFVGFQLLVGGMILAALLHTVFLAALLFRLGTQGVVGLVPEDIWDWFSVGILATGYGGAFAIVASGLLRQRAAHLLPMQLLLPFYWILHSIAAGRAALELISRPDYWAKTTHGVTRLSRSAAVSTSGPAAIALSADVDAKLHAEGSAGIETPL